MVLVQFFFRTVVRYRLLHVVFWTWQLFSMAHVVGRKHRGGLLLHLVEAATLVVFEMAAVYTTIYLLVPRYFNRGRYLLFSLATVIVILCSAFLAAATDDLFVYLTLNKRIFSYLIAMISSVTDMTMLVGIFLAIVIVQNKLKADRLARKQENERMRAELEFLKAQINPHFLFNTINNIYVLIDEDKKKGSGMLLRFSDLLRYQLYECNEGPVPISRELHFLKNFIAMEQLRIGEVADVSVDIPDEQDYCEIHPFLLLPFVENAFKHVSRHDDAPNFISVCAHAAKGVFHLCVRNSKDLLPASTPGGIGLVNVRRRLELLYPERHRLDVRSNNMTHTIDLKIYVH